MRLNLGPGEHYAAGWLNVDVEEAVAHGIRCDLIVDPAHPFASFGDGQADQVYLGHVLEHIPWPEVPALLCEVYRVLEPGGRVLVVGPDVWRTLCEWRQGNMPQELLEAVLEDAAPEGDAWPERSHKWNCSEARVVGLLERAGFVNVAPTEDFEGWPIGDTWSAWQMAVGAVVL